MATVSIREEQAAQAGFLGEHADMGQTLDTFLRQAAVRYGAKPALLFKPRYRTEIWSYARLEHEATRVACWLRGQGIGTGDRVLLWAPNSPWWVAAFFGCLRSGAVLVPLDVRSSPDFVARVAGQTEPRLALLSRAMGGTWDLAMPTAWLEDLAALPDPPGNAGGPTPRPDDIAEVIFTSGTTGDPKGVMLTHANIRANVESANQVIPQNPRFRLLSILPLGHMFEQTVGLLLPLRRGASVYYPASRQSTLLFRDLREQGITTVLAVPQALALFMAALEREVEKKGRQRQWKMMLRVAAHLPLVTRRLLFRGVHQRLGGQVRFFVSGGAPLEAELARAWELLGIPVVQGYGATEAAPVIASTFIDDRNPRSVGKAVPGVDLKLAQDGEVLVRGANVTSGYWRNQTATAAAFQGGWYKTGDLGELDQEGYLYLRGRKKDLIVLANGQNVYPEDVEAALRQAPGVLDAVVLGLPSPGGLRLHAVLVCAAGAEEPRAIMRQANSRLAAHQQVQDVTLWPGTDFPRTHTLKVKRQEVLHAIQGQQEARKEAVTPAAAPAATGGVPALQRLIAQAAGVSPSEVMAQAALGDTLGLDSLQRVELLAAVEEELGVYLDESQVGPHTTVAELEALVGGQQSSARPGFPRWPLSPPAVTLRTALQGAAFTLLDRVTPARVHGREVLAGLQPPVLFVANHTSHLDSPVVLRALPPIWRGRVAVAAAADYFFTRTALGAAVALGLNAFPFSRTTSVRPTLEHCAWLLDGGWSILLFPEGTRSPTGNLGAFKAGAGLLAVELGVPVVPVHIGGLHRVLPRGRHLPRPGRVTVRFGQPLRFDACTPYAAATTAIEEAVRGLSRIR